MHTVTGSENEDGSSHNRLSHCRCIRLPDQYRDENAGSEWSETECVIGNIRKPLISEIIVFGLTVTAVASRPTRTVCSEAIQYHIGLCVHHIPLKISFLFFCNKLLLPCACSCNFKLNVLLILPAVVCVCP